MNGSVFHAKAVVDTRTDQVLVVPTIVMDLSLTEPWKLRRTSYAESLGSGAPLADSLSGEKVQVGAYMLVRSRIARSCCEEVSGRAQTFAAVRLR